MFKKVSAGLALIAASMSEAMAQNLDFIEDSANLVKDSIDTAAIVIVAVAILVAGIGMLFFRMEGSTAGRILMGGVLVGAATSISTVLVGLGA